MRGGRRQARRKLSLWSKRGLGELDGRLIEAREERRIIVNLTAHVGGNPSIPQALMIKRCARLVLMTAALERRVLERGELGDLQQRQLCALSNSLRLYLVAIGLDRPEHEAPRLADVLKVKAA